MHISKIIRNFASEKVMMSENKRNLTEKEEYYKLITDEKSNHIETNANGAGSQCVRRKNIGSLSFRERYLSLRLQIRITSWLSIKLRGFFLFSVTQNQPQISSRAQRILKIAIPKLSKELLKYVSEKQTGSLCYQIQYRWL